MLEFLRDAVWQFVGALFALAAIGVSVWVYIAQTPRKRLLIQRVARVPLVTVGADRIPGLQITIDGRKIEKATVVLIRITNSGKVPLMAGDFDQNITLDFEAGAVVLDAQIADTQPKYQPITTEHSANLVSFSKNLMNPGDTFLCRVLIQDSSGNYVPKARVAGVREIDISPPFSVFRPVVTLVALSIVIVSWFLSPTPRSSGLSDFRTEEIPYLVIMLFGLIVMIVTTLTDAFTKVKPATGRTALLHDID